MKISKSVIAGIGLVVAAIAAIIYFYVMPQSSASTGGGQSSGSSSSSSSSGPVTTSSSANAIYNNFVASGYIAQLQNEGLTSDVAAARQNPSSWLAQHPYLYQVFPNYFQPS
jgi:hypothetical protein